MSDHIRTFSCSKLNFYLFQRRRSVWRSNENASLTAVGRLIRSVHTVIVTVTHPNPWDAALTDGALELVRGTSDFSCKKSAKKKIPAFTSQLNYKLLMSERLQSFNVFVSLWRVNSQRINIVKIKHEQAISSASRNTIMERGDLGVNRYPAHNVCSLEYNIHYVQTVTSDMFDKS